MWAKCWTCNAVLTDDEDECKREEQRPIFIRRTIYPGKFGIVWICPSCWRMQVPDREPSRIIRECSNEEG